MDRYLLGFDIGGTKCAAILGRKTNGPMPQIIEKTVFATAECGNPNECVAKFTMEARRLLVKHGVNEAELYALGISCGGPLDSRKGLVLSPPNLPGWDNVPIVELLSRHFPCPVFLQNDANAGAVAEWKYGAGVGTENMLFLTFGTGLGAGLILGGRLYTGANDNAGECGHMRLDRIGPVGYGKAGSFEGFCSGGGIAQMAQSFAQEAILDGKNVSWYVEGEMPSAKIVAEAATLGDDTAIEVFKECGRHLGQGLSVLIDVLNPELIVIGSIFARAEHLLRDEMQKTIDAEALPFSAQACRIVPAQLNENIGDYASLAIADQSF